MDQSTNLARVNQYILGNSGSQMASLTSDPQNHHSMTKESFRRAGSRGASSRTTQIRGTDVVSSVSHHSFLPASKQISPALTSHLNQLEKCNYTRSTSFCCLQDLQLTPSSSHHNLGSQCPATLPGDCQQPSFKVVTRPESSQENPEFGDSTGLSLHFAFPYSTR